jgi:hypothetical protein
VLTVTVVAAAAFLPEQTNRSNIARNANTHTTAGPEPPRNLKPSASNSIWRPCTSKNSKTQNAETPANGMPCTARACYVITRWNALTSKSPYRKRNPTPEITSIKNNHPSLLTVSPLSTVASFLASDMTTVLSVDPEGESYTQPAETKRVFSTALHSSSK